MPTSRLKQLGPREVERVTQGYTQGLLTRWVSKEPGPTRLLLQLC